MKRIILIIFSFITLINEIDGQQYSNKTTSSLDLKWTNRGPDDIGGLTKAIIWDKNDENVLYAGGVASGLFKTTDKGASWERIESYSENNPSILSLSQSINGSIFVGTGYIGSYPGGNIFSTTFRGKGMYRSQDDGDSWVHLTETDPDSSFSWKKVNVIANHPTNSNIIMVGNDDGVQLSINAESNQPSFTSIYGINTSQRATDIVFSSDGLDAWIAKGGRIYKSNNTSTPFSTYTQQAISVSASRAQLAITKTNSNDQYTIYASFTGNGGCLAAVFKSEDKGITWEKIINAGGIDPFTLPNQPNNCQGWYDHTLAVNPADNNKLYIGGVTLASWDPIDSLVIIDDVNNVNAQNYIPIDKHRIIINPHNNSGNEMIVSGDGGIYYSENILAPFNDIAFKSLNNSYYTSLNINSSTDMNGNILVSTHTGYQYVDFNTNNDYSSSKIYKEKNGLCEISKYDENVFFYSGIYGKYKRSSDKGSTNFPFLDHNIDVAGCNTMTCNIFSSPDNCQTVAGQSFFNFPYLNEIENNSVFFTSSTCSNNKFFICKNPLNTNEIPIFNSINLPFQSNIKTMHGSADGDRLVAVANDNIIIIDSINNFTPTIPDDILNNTNQLTITIISLQSIGFNSIASVYIDKNDKNHLLITEDSYYNNAKIAYSIDGGINWINIKSNLPNRLPIYDCIIDKENADRYFIATEKGIWATTDKGVTWNQENDGIGQILPIRQINQTWMLEEDCYVLVATSAGSGVYISTTLTNCNKDVDDEIWGQVNGVEISLVDDIFNIFPNPTNSILTLSLKIENNENINFKIISIIGETLYKKDLSASAKDLKTTSINIDFLAKGTYLIELTIDGKHSTKKFIKN